MKPFVMTNIGDSYLSSWREYGKNAVVTFYHAGLADRRAERDGAECDAFQFSRELKCTPLTCRWWPLCQQPANRSVVLLIESNILSVKSILPCMKPHP